MIMTHGRLMLPPPSIYVLDPNSTLTWPNLPQMSAHAYGCMLPRDTCKICILTCKFNCKNNELYMNIRKHINAC